MQPLDGIRVLDLSRVLAGPYCTMVLGDLGAEVIKVEPPQGDETRAWGPPFAGGESSYYLCVNRNKRGMSIDLKSPTGPALLQDLARCSDILVENFRPGTLSKYGLDYEALRVQNQRLIYCSISGFGQAGPMRDRPGYDLIIQAMGGLMSLTGEPGGEPMKVGVAVSDIAAGLFAVVAILAAVQARHKTGKGQHVDIALFDSQVAWLANIASGYLLSGELPKRYGNAHANIVPYQAFQASDGYFVLAVGNDSQFGRLCDLIEQPGLASDSRFVTNEARLAHREVLIPILESTFRENGVAHWLAGMDRLAIPAGPINSLDRVFAEPQVQERELLVSMTHPTAGRLPLVASPLRMSGTPIAHRLPPPRFGEHTDEILADLLGRTPAEIQALHRTGAVA